MRERPILFSAPMVRAILEGRKTVMRRPMKGIALDWLAGASFTPEYVASPANGLCPYGQPGDRLWVRESWQYADWTDDGYPWVRYAADHAKKLHDRSPSEEWSERWTDIWAALSADDNYTIDDTAADRRWRPSIHMPRWASRITLEVTSMRVERLQDISEADALSEGIRELPLQEHEPGAWWCADPLGNQTLHFRTPRAAFCNLWESINGADSWNANPWVWVIEFRRADMTEPERMAA